MSDSKKVSKVWPKRKCVIKRCSTYAGLGIPMHRFPQDEDKLIKWINATDVNCVSLNTLICGLHFKKSDYKNLGSKKRVLLQNAVPSLNILNDNEMQDKEETINSVDDCISDEECDHENEHGEEKDVHQESQDFQNENQNNTIRECMANEVSDSNVECECENNCSRQNVTDEIRNLESEVGSSIIETLITRLSSPEKNTFENNEKEAIKTISRGVQIDNEEIIKSLDKISTSVQTDRYTLMNCIKSDSNLLAFTGINFQLLEALVKSIQLIYPKVRDKNVCSLSERVVLVLCKLKLYLSYECLGALFGINRSTASKYFFDTVPLLASVLEEAIYFPDREEIQENMPVHFKNLKETRIVLDCTEIGIENSKCLKCRLKMYSHYKGKQTLKVLIGVTPSGLISFCSKCYGGRASDKVIFQQSGLLDKLTPGIDAVMVDKGFLIESDCKSRNIKVIRPPFASQKEQMSTEDAKKTRGIAAARVHIERVIQRLKTFAILKNTVKWEMSKCFDMIMIIICGIVNLSRPILDKTRYSA